MSEEIIPILEAVATEYKTYYGKQHALCQAALTRINELKDQQNATTIKPRQKTMTTLMDTFIKRNKESLSDRFTNMSSAITSTIRSPSGMTRFESSKFRKNY